MKSDPLRTGAEPPFLFTQCVQRLGAVLVAVTLVCWPGSASAQWTQGGVGNGWVKSTMVWQRTPTRFDDAGRRQPWLGNGEANSQVTLVDLVLGVRENVDVWVEVVHLNLEFTRRSADTLRRAGLGDARVWVRWQFARFNSDKTPLAVRVGAKAPVGSSPIDAQILPFGEGQWDFEAVGELGHTFTSLPVQAFVWFGYRARLASTRRAIDPGGEFILYSEVNVRPTSRTVVKAAYDALVSRAFKSNGITTATKRRLHTIQATGGVRVSGSTWFDGGLRIPLAGQSNPAGIQVVLGVSTSFSR